MFFLKKNHCDHLDCDEFGWWLTGSKPEPQTFEDVLTSADSTQSLISRTEPDDGNSFVIVQESEAAVPNGKSDDLQGSVHRETGDDDPEEICFAEEPPCKTSSRSYTPERLVRNQDYTILSPSPTFSTTSQTELTNTLGTTCRPYSNRRHRRLNHLIDKKLVGASHLQALLDPGGLDVELPAATARRKTWRARFPTKEYSCSGELLAIANSDSPGSPLTPDLTSSGSSCERLNCEWHRYDSLTITGEDSSRIEQFGELGKAFGTGSNSGENFLGDETSTQDSWRRGPGSETEEDPVFVVQQLRGRIDDIKDTNRDILGDIYSLRKNFQWAETKTGNLTTETIRLRREIQDLRYLDDLVNLLRGELERISRRNWPFNLGHTDHHSEEVNLVV